MQQTDKYNFNLIENEDVFSPQPLNENMEMVAKALTRLEAADSASTAAVADLDQRVKTLELHRMAIGVYNGGKLGTVELGFTPKFVFFHGLGKFYTSTIILTEDLYPNNVQGRIIENGFVLEAGVPLNSSTGGTSTCVYIAFA